MGLGNGDIKLIRQLIEDNNDEVEQRFEKVATRLKSDFFDKIDPILKGVASSREEREIVARRLALQNDEIEKIKRSLKL